MALSGPTMRFDSREAKKRLKSYRKYDYDQQRLQYAEEQSQHSVVKAAARRTVPSERRALRRRSFAERGGKRLPSPLPVSSASLASSRSAWFSIPAASAFGS